MWRYLIVLVLFALLAPEPMAQRPLARVYLKSGRVVEGPVVKADEEKVIIRLTELEVTIRATDIERIEEIDHTERVDPLRSLPTASLPPADPPAPAAAEVTPSGVTSERPATNGSIDRGVAIRNTPPRPSRVMEGPAGPDHHLSRWLDRYLWLVPQSTGHRASVGAALLLALALVVHWSTKVAALDTASFARSSLVAAVVFAGFIGQMSFEVENPLIVFAMMFVDLLLWFLMVRMVFSAGPLSATVMLVCCTLSGMVAILCVEVMGYLIQQQDKVA